MMKKIKKVLFNEKGFVLTIEMVASIAIVSIIIVAVGLKLYPIIAGNNGLLEKSANRVIGVEDVMKP